MTAGNIYLGAWFSPVNDARIDFHSGIDGIRFRRLNCSAVPHGSAGKIFNGRDPFVMANNGELLVAVTNYRYGNYDSVFYKVTDGFTPSRFEVKLGPAAIASATVPMPGGTQPADLVWSPKFFRDTDGKLYATLTVRYGDDFVDTYGVMVKHKRVFVSECLDESSLIFGAPVQLDFGADTQSMIDAHIILWDGEYYLATKDENTKNLRIYKSTGIYGLWSFVVELSSPHQIEGPCFVTHYVRDGQTTTRRLRLYADAYQVGKTLFFEADSPDGPWSAPQFITTSGNIRHGSVINLMDCDVATRDMCLRSMAATGSDENRPAFGVTLPAAQTIATTDWAQVNFSATDIDTHEMHDPASSSIIVTEPGRYHFSVQAIAYGLPAGGESRIAIRRNGAIVRQAPYGNPAGLLTLFVAASAQCDVGDVIDVAVKMTGAGSKTITWAGTNTYFEGASA